MQTKAMYILHIYNDADYKNISFYACVCFVRLQLLICYVITCLQRINDRFCDKVRVWVYYFWSAQCIETQARTSDDVKTWVFISLNVQWWSFVDNVVYCNTLQSFKATYLELEKAMFTGALLVPIFTIIPLGPYTHSKQSNQFMPNVSWR